MTTRTPTTPKPTPSPAKWKAGMPYPAWPFARVSGRELQKRHTTQTQAAALASVGSAIV